MEIRPEQRLGELFAACKSDCADGCRFGCVGWLHRFDPPDPPDLRAGEDPSPTPQQTP